MSHTSNVSTGSASCGKQEAKEKEIQNFKNLLEDIPWR